MSGLCRNNLDLIREILAEGESGATNGAEHIASVGEFLDAHLLAEADITELPAGGASDLADLKFAADRGLTESQGGIKFEIGSEMRHGLGEEKLIETVSQ